MTEVTISEVTLAFKADNYLGETPIWSASDQALWWVNCENPPELHRWTPDSNAHEIWPMPQRIGGFVAKQSGGLLVALADGLYDFSPETGELKLRVKSPLPDHVKLHECHCDRQGRFWIGSYDHHFPADRQARGGHFFRLDGAQLTPVLSGISVSNGLAFSPDGTILYLSDTPTGRVDAYDLDDSGMIANGRPFIQLGEGEGFLDGATVDSEGGYWLANVAAGALRRYLPDGTLDRIIPLPFSNPTKPAFGGADMKTLFITSTQMKMRPYPGVNADNIAQNGGIFALRPGEMGVVETDFAG